MNTRSVAAKGDPNKNTARCIIVTRTKTMNRDRIMKVVKLKSKATNEETSRGSAKLLEAILQT